MVDSWETLTSRWTTSDSSAIGLPPREINNWPTAILTQHIEGGFQKKYVTGGVLVDLSAAYDAVNHHLLLKKIFRCPKMQRLQSQ